MAPWVRRDFFPRIEPERETTARNERTGCDGRIRSGPKGGTAMEYDLEQPAVRELDDSEIDSVSGGVFVVRAKPSTVFPTTGA
jgi:hypothetical protein